MALVVQYTPPRIDAAAILTAAAPAIAVAGAQTLLEASKPLVPVESGALRDSGKVTLDGTHAKVTYSATAEDGYPYGIRQHEDMTLHHPRGGQAKFLEQPMHTEGPAILVAMGAALRAAL